MPENFCEMDCSSQFLREKKSGGSLSPSENTKSKEVAFLSPEKVSRENYLNQTGRAENASLLCRVSCDSPLTVT